MASFTKGKGEQRLYFEHPGAIMLMVAAIAESMEALLGRPIINTFQPRFKGKPEPTKCVGFWVPVVEALSPLAHRNLKPVLKASGPPRDLPSGVLQAFRNHVEAMVENGDDRWTTFAGKVTLKN